MLVFVDAGGGGWLPPVGGAGAGCGPRFCRWEESKGKSGGWEGAAPPHALLLCRAGFLGDKETDHVLGSRDFQIPRKGRHAACVRQLKWLLISKRDEKKKMTD